MSAVRKRSSRDLSLLRNRTGVKKRAGRGCGPASGKILLIEETALMCPGSDIGDMMGVYIIERVL